jgi:hypothetical protein
VSPGASRGVVTSQPAGRRIPFRLWLVSGDALGERDATRIGEDAALSNTCCAINSLPVRSVFTAATSGMD